MVTSNTELRRCLVCNGIVPPVHRKPTDPCTPSCNHRPYLHAACARWPISGAVYGPAEPPPGYTVVETKPIAVETTDGYTCQEFGYWYQGEHERVWTCDCSGHEFFCVGCGTVEHSADGKVYFYVDDQADVQWVCWDCVRGPNPNYIRLDYNGRVI